MDRRRSCPKMSCKTPDGTRKRRSGRFLSRRGSMTPTASRKARPFFLKPKMERFQSTANLRKNVLLSNSKELQKVVEEQEEEYEEQTFQKVKNENNLTVTIPKSKGAETDVSDDEEEREDVYGGRKPFISKRPKLVKQISGGRKPLMKSNSCIINPGVLEKYRLSRGINSPNSPPSPNTAISNFFEKINLINLEKEELETLLAKACQFGRDLLERLRKQERSEGELLQEAERRRMMERRDLEFELSESQKKFNDLKVDHDFMKEKYTKTKHQLKRYKNESNVLRKKVHFLSEKVRVAEEEILSQVKEIEFLKFEVKKKKEQNESLRIVVENMKEKEINNNNNDNEIEEEEEEEREEENGLQEVGYEEMEEIVEEEEKVRIRQHQEELQQQVVEEEENGEDEGEEEYFEEEEEEMMRLELQERRHSVIGIVKYETEEEETEFEEETEEEEFEDHEPEPQQEEFEEPESQQQQQEEEEEVVTEEEERMERKRLLQASRRRLSFRLLQKETSEEEKERNLRRESLEIGEKKSLELLGEMIKKKDESIMLLQNEQMKNLTLQRENLELGRENLRLEKEVEKYKLMIIDMENINQERRVKEEEEKEGKEEFDNKKKKNRWSNNNSEVEMDEMKKVVMEQAIVIREQKESIAKFHNQMSMLFQSLSKRSYGCFSSCI